MLQYMFEIISYSLLIQSQFDKGFSRCDIMFI